MLQMPVYRGGVAAVAAPSAFFFQNASEPAAAEAAKRGEAEAMLKKLLAEGMSADEIIDKLK